MELDAAGPSKEGHMVKKSNNSPAIFLLVVTVVVLLVIMEVEELPPNGFNKYLLSASPVQAPFQAIGRQQ